MFHYNHLARGDYNTEALISKWPLRNFLMFLQKKTSKMKENAVVMIITLLLFSSGSVNIVE